MRWIASFWSFIRATMVENTGAAHDTLVALSAGILTLLGTFAISLAIEWWKNRRETLRAIQDEDRISRLALAHYMDDTKSG